jgi:choline dehydrogenase
MSNYGDTENRQDISNLECDYLVVGAGASGCVAAARLSEIPDNRIILLEAGGSDRNPFLWLPGLGFAASSLAQYNWNFQSEEIPELNGRRITLAEGKVVGGSSSINGMIYTRGHSSEYDKWRDMGCEGWGFDDLLPYFRKSESNFRGADKWHGGDGPMPLRRANPELPICDAFLAAARAAGLPVVDDLNANHPAGLGWYDVNIDRGLRMSSARAFLGQARKRKNFTLLSKTMALRILISGNRVIGVEAMRNGKRIHIHARREIILSAGAIKTPQLLMLSGIGPAEQLSQHGIKPVADVPQIGRNLQNHPCYRPYFVCNDRVTARNHVSVTGAARAGFAWLFRRSGPLAESFASVGGFFRSDPALPLADMQVVLLSAMPPSGGQGIFDLLPRQQGFGMTIYQGTPHSRGSVSLRSADPFVPPVLELGYFRDPRDIETLASGVERMLEIVRRPEIARYISHCVAPGDDVRSGAALIKAIRRDAATSYHQCGTCAMGPDDDAPLDARLRLRAVDGLRVADTSIMPILPNASLHAPALMIGEKAAAMILQDNGHLSSEPEANNDSRPMVNPQ